MNYFVGEKFDQVKEMCIFLLNDKSLIPTKALAVYVQAPGSTFQYRGAVHIGCPSANLALLWPIAPHSLTSNQPISSAQIGVSVEDLATLPALNVGSQSKIEQIARKVGENLFNYMMSFCTVYNNQLLVPKDVFDQWFMKFQEKVKKDPEYLNKFTE